MTTTARVCCASASRALRATAPLPDSSRCAWASSQACTASCRCCARSTPPARSARRGRAGSSHAPADRSPRVLAVGSFLRIDGEEALLNAGRLTWYPAVSEHERGLAVHVAAHGPRSLLHVAVFVPGISPSDLSSREATIVEAGPDAAVDGRMFGALLLRFGRVGSESAVLSLDGEVEGILSGSEARSQVAADITCSVEAGEVPTFCQRC